MASPKPRSLIRQFFIVSAIALISAVVFPLIAHVLAGPEASPYSRFTGYEKSPCQDADGAIVIELGRSDGDHTQRISHGGSLPACVETYEFDWSDYLFNVEFTLFLQALGIGLVGCVFAVHQMVKKRRKHPAEDSPPRPEDLPESRPIQHEYLH